MISKRQHPLLMGWGLSLISLCALQATAATHTDANGNVGYDTLAECVAAIESGDAKFYQPFTTHPPLKRTGETEVNVETNCCDSKGCGGRQNHVRRHVIDDF